MVIAIDGPAGAGKSTVARALARELGFAYLDTGAMYRCVALAALRMGGGTLPESPGALGELARTLTIELCKPAHGALAGEDRAAAAGADPDVQRRVLLDGQDVTNAIRTPEVSEAASAVAADQGVRDSLVAKQRQLVAGGDWVAEGRDIGAVVAPAAALKLFLTADPRERARRRAAELGAALDTVLAEQTIRDQRDSTREHSPLSPAPGAITLDTSGMNVEQVVQRIAELVRDL